ncbi:uncharacterized protein LOC130445039 isoform X1 [Diorhabda sublineata]|uniref:uncharacterized protein LOC130445039 isoform X1 n=1 Tax=Diorhabda sublineata TaxID=1163346 RepID=UPI0024E10299|nr:uncharacterized protein LOC130445039 isoform X1 [Diorhabda sublineata]XP_056636497.1 uncharacterized protein LOC130445039 isoform X1 [Diorhabda sublineata]
MILPNWTPRAVWNTETLALLNEVKTDVIPNQTVQNIITESTKFPLAFSTSTNKCNYLKSVVKEEVLEKNINSVFPILHESIINLCCIFLLYKRQYGNCREEQFFQKLGLKDLIARFIMKRPAAFLKPNDEYKLLDGAAGEGSWESVGTNKEKPPLIIDNYMEYDEMKLSAFLSISSFTHFVNRGERNNVGKYETDRSKVEDIGIIVGMVGPRLEKSNVMEYQEIVITPNQNTEDNGFGNNVKRSIPKLFANFYEEKCSTYNETLIAKGEDQVGRYIDILRGDIFDNYFYYKRLAITFDTLLIEANHRSKQLCKSAYLHVVGLGLGVWKVSDHQNKIYMETFADRIQFLGEKLYNVSDICFSHLRVDKCGKYSDGEIFIIKGHPNGGIKIHIYNREPHSKLIGKDTGKLLVVSYAWDGNSLPGNDYWIGSLSGSGDSACACSTQICELHNPHINSRVRVDNLRIVTLDANVVTLNEYKNIVNRKCTTE